MEHADGDTPAWPFRYDELEPWYDEAERLYQVRGDSGEDPTEPPRSRALPFPPVPDERADRRARERLRAIGLHPVLAAARRRHRRSGSRADRRRGTPFPTPAPARWTRETCAADPGARPTSNVAIESGAEVTRLIAARRRQAHRARRISSRTARPAACRPTAGRARGRRGQLGGAAARARREGGARQPVRHGRPQLHEPQPHGDAGDRSAADQRRGLPEDLRDQRLLPFGRRGRPAARQRPASRQGLRRDPQGEPAMGARGAAPGDEPPHASTS